MLETVLIEMILLLETQGRVSITIKYNIIHDIVNDHFSSLVTELELGLEASSTRTKNNNIQSQSKEVHNP